MHCYLCACSCRILDLLHSFQPVDELDGETIHFSRPIEPQLFESTDGKPSIHFPLVDDNVLNAQVMQLPLKLISGECQSSPLKVTDTKIFMFKGHAFLSSLILNVNIFFLSILNFIENTYFDVRSTGFICC